MTAPESLATARLCLRRCRPADSQAIFSSYAQDPEVTRYLVWQPHRSLADTQAFTAFADAAWHQGREFTWAIWTPAGELIGGLALRPTGPKADVGYVLARSHWGRGYATEALSAVLAWALAQPGLYRVWGTCDVDNLASARVLEKAGMQREGLLRRWCVHPNLGDEPRDSWCYAWVRP